MSCIRNADLKSITNKESNSTVQSFAKVSDYLKNMSIWQLNLIIASFTMTKHMYTFQNCQFFSKVQCSKFISHSLTVYLFILVFSHIFILQKNNQKFISH